jgi:hypothetical protein
MSQRTSRRSLVIGCSLSTLALATLPLASAHPAGASVSIGEVRVSGGSLAFEAALRNALSSELSQLGIARIGARRPLVVSVTLRKLTSSLHAGSASASAAISLALRSADEQLLLAELTGRASAHENSLDVQSVRQAALRAAVRSAVTRLPDVAARLR